MRGCLVKLVHQSFCSMLEKQLHSHAKGHPRSFRSIIAHACQVLRGPVHCPQVVRDRPWLTVHKQSPDPHQTGDMQACMFPSKMACASCVLDGHWVCMMHAQALTILVQVCKLSKLHARLIGLESDHAFHSPGNAMVVSLYLLLW